MLDEHEQDARASGGARSFNMHSTEKIKITEKNNVIMP